jgi:chromosome partitioning protein
VKQTEPSGDDMSFGSFEDSPLARELADLTKRRKRVADVTAPLPRTTRVITVSNQKGGVGKTTTAVNVAAAMAKLGARVLVIDLDPQGNASTALGVQHHADVPSVYDVLIDDFPLTEVIQQSPEFDTLFCAPSTIHLAGAEIELVSQVAREHRLRTALEDLQRTVEQPYHYIFIDCPPSLGLLTINAFVAASEVMIPIQCEYYALEGLSQLLGSIELIQKHLNPTLSLQTILLTMFDGRTNLANQVADDVRSHFTDKVLQAVIPRAVRISEAPSFGQTVISYDPSSLGAISYLEAANEMARRYGDKLTTSPQN